MWQGVLVSYRFGDKHLNLDKSALKAKKHKMSSQDIERQRQTLDIKLPPQIFDDTILCRGKSMCQRVLLKRFQHLFIDKGNFGQSRLACGRQHLSDGIVFAFFVGSQMHLRVFAVSDFFGKSLFQFL